MKLNSWRIWVPFGILSSIAVLAFTTLDPPETSIALPGTFTTDQITRSVAACLYQAGAPRPPLLARLTAQVYGDAGARSFKQGAVTMNIGFSHEYEHDELANLRRQDGNQEVLEFHLKDRPLFLVGRVSPESGDAKSPDSVFGPPVWLAGPSKKRTGQGISLNAILHPASDPDGIGSAVTVEVPIPYLSADRVKFHRTYELPADSGASRGPATNFTDSVEGLTLRIPAKAGVFRASDDLGAKLAARLKMDVDEYSNCLLHELGQPPLKR